jgi:hypothetical protein
MAKRKDDIKNKIESTINKIKNKTKQEAIDYLIGMDMILANHCYFEVFGENIPKEYRQ